MSDFDAIDPRRAICFLPMSGQYRQDVGPNLVVDGGMEAVGTGAYAPFDATLSKQGGAYAGNQCLRVAKLVGNVPYCLQANKRVSGFWYKGSVRARSNGSGVPRVVAFGTMDGTNSTSWQLLSGAGVASDTSIYLQSNGPVAGQYSEFDEFELYEYPLTARNLSLALGVPAYVRLGDGHTAASLPTQRNGRGFNFNGAQYINLNWSAGSLLDTQTFTVVALVQPTAPTADGRIYEIGIAGQRYSLFYDLSESTLIWHKDDVADVTITSGYGAAYGQPFVVAASISADRMRLMVDDRVMGEQVGDLRLASFNAATKAYFGQDIAGGNRYKGSMIQSAVYPVELTQLQIREIGRRMRQMRNV